MKSPGWLHRAGRSTGNEFKSTLTLPDRASVPSITRTETLVVVGVTAVAWLLNSQFILFRPVLWLATFVHEAMHALAAMLLGLPVHSVTINRYGGGLAYTGGDGSTFETIVVASAGYVGAGLVGAAALELCKRLRTARAACLGVATLVVTVGLLWVPWNFRPTAAGALITRSSSSDGRFTTFFWILAAAVFVLLAVQPVVRLRRGVVLVVATALCLLSVESLKVVLDISAHGGDSDATTVASVTPLSSWMWSALWLLFGVVVLLLSAWSLVGTDHPKTSSTGAPESVF